MKRRRRNGKPSSNERFTKEIHRPDLPTRLHPAAGETPPADGPASTTPRGEHGRRSTRRGTRGASTQRRTAKPKSNRTRTHPTGGSLDWRVSSSSACTSPSGSRRRLPRTSVTSASRPCPRGLTLAWARCRWRRWATKGAPPFGCACTTPRRSSCVRTSAPGVNLRMRRSVRRITTTSSVSSRSRRRRWRVATGRRSGRLP